MYKRRLHFTKPKRRAGRVPQKLRIRPGADASLKKVFAGIGIPSSKAFQADPFQTEALEVIENSDCLVTAPTGAGKTWIAEQAIARFREKNGKSWYACPLKALSNAKYAEFSSIFGSQNVGILTGDLSSPVIARKIRMRRLSSAPPKFCATSFTMPCTGGNHWRLTLWLATDFVVLDEAHFLGDEDRGVVWEEIMIYLPVRIPLLLLSATIGNADQIADWLASIRSTPCRVVEETVRPVPLFPLFFHPSGTLLPLIVSAQQSHRQQLHKKVNQFIKARHRKNFGNPRL